MSERRALVIGIDRYQRLPYPLEGCVNDALVIADLLEERFGFDRGAIVPVLNEDATRDRILAELDGLVEATGRDDVVVIAYSGHGSQMRDREGDEAEAMDETIVPHDSGRGVDENRDITDDELYLRLLALTERTRYVTLLFDCCHSGSISRDAFGARVRWVPADLRSADELPPSPVPRDTARAGGRDLGPSGWLPLSERYVLLAGCLDDESSYEHVVVEDGQRIAHGALSYFLMRQISGAAADASYRDVFEPASAMVTATYPRQHPQMEGAADRELFGLRMPSRTRSVRVQRRSAGSVTLRAGLAHGATVGSRWAVYPPTTKEVTAETTRLGVVELTTLRATESDGVTAEERVPGEIAVGCRAVEEAHAFGDQRLRVEVVAAGAAERAALRSAIEASDLLVAADDGAAADMRVYLVAPRSTATPDAPVPQLGAVTEPTWVTVGVDGRLSMPPRGADGSAVSAIVQNLETASRYRRVLSLQNPDPGPLLGRVDLVLLRRLGDTWAEVQHDRASHRVTFTEGDSIAFEIRSTHTVPLHVSVLDLGVSGAIGLLHPIAGASEPLSPGHTLQVGVRPGQEIRLVFPDAFEATTDPSDPAGPESIETFKLIATTAPADFDAILQPGYRAARTDAGTPVEDLAGLVLTGRGARDAVRPTGVGETPDDGWITVERSFTLRRKGT